MTWTYIPQELATSSLMQLRLLIGDTLVTDQQLQDEELAEFIGSRSTIYGAAAEACRSLATKFARSVTRAAGSSKVNWSDLYKAYLMMATNFESQAALMGGGPGYAGGISEADKQAQEMNPDRVPPAFNVGMDDNVLPLPPAGNQEVRVNED